MRALLFILLVSLTLSSCRDSSQDTPLERALRSANPAPLEKLFEQPVDVKSPMSNGQSPLLLAVNLRNVKGVEMLLRHGADHQVTDEKGRSLFDILWGQGDPGHREWSCIGLLLDSGFTLPQDADELGRTWLHHLADRCDDPRIPKALAKQGFDINAKDANGWTPLHLATLSSRYNSCVGLLEQGADVNAQTSKEVSHILTEADGSEHVRFLYMAGSQPLDLERQTSTRGNHDQDIAKLLKDAGGKKNPAVNNVL